MLTNKRLKILTFTVCCLATAGQVFAQAQVVDAAGDRGPGTVQQSQQAPQQTTSGQNDIMVEMYLQIEALKNEIQNLRGLVEEQSYAISRMQQDQRDRYLDLDSRVSELFSYHSGQQPVGIQSPVGVQPGPATGQSTPAAGQEQPGAVSQAVAGNTVNNPAAAATTLASPQNEQELYRQALNLLLEEEAFQDSVNLFQQYIDVYPEGRYFTNALYWQGAALHLLGNFAQSIAVLQRLVDEYPQDPKAPTAMLRIGTVYNEMGNRNRAVEYWQRLRQTYPNSTSDIEIASEYLSEAGL